MNSREDDIEDVHSDDYDRLSEVYQRHYDHGEDFSVEYRIHRSNGALCWIREKGTTLRSASGEVIQSIGVLQDITEQTDIEQSLREARDSLEAMVKSRTRKLAVTVKQLEGEIREREKIAAELDFLANHDALTGLPSLRLCKDRLDQSLAEARRNRQISAVMFLDLDGFREVNDEHGHEFGDLVLKATANRIKAEIREIDTVARIGGDEFLVILASVPDLSAPDLSIVERIACNLIQQVSQPIVLDGNEVAVGTSVGISIYPDDVSDADELIRVANKAMYLIKSGGKNNFGFARASRLN